MQIVIDIPENAYYNFILLGKKINNVEERQIIQAFENGTPLPEHHGRLIDADAYREAWFNSRQFEPMLLLDFAPTVIEADKEEE